MKKITKMYMGRASKKKKEKLISHLNLNLVVLHDSSLSLSAAYFSIVCITDRRNLLFRSIELDS